MTIPNKIGRSMKVKEMQ